MIRLLSFGAAGLMISAALATAAVAQQTGSPGNAPSQPDPAAAAQAQVEQAQAEAARARAAAQAQADALARQRTAAAFGPRTPMVTGDDGRPRAIGNGNFGQTDQPATPAPSPYGNYYHIGTPWNP